MFAVEVQRADPVPIVILMKRGEQFRTHFCDSAETVVFRERPRSCDEKDRKTAGELSTNHSRVALATHRSINAKASEKVTPRGSPSSLASHSTGVSRQPSPTTFGRAS